MPTSTLVAATVPAALAAAELVREARALKQVYQQTWHLEDLEAQIRCHLRALDFLCEASENARPPNASVTPAPKHSVVEEPLEKEEDGHRTCKISA